MIHILLSRWSQGHRTLPYPKELPALPKRFRGRPSIQFEKCPEDCARCTEACATGAIQAGLKGPSFDLGRCLFCSACA